MVRTLAFALALLPLLLALPAHAQAGVAAGTYEIVPGRALARLTVKSFVGTVEAELPARSGTLTFDERGGIVGGEAVLDAAALTGPSEAIGTLLEKPTGLDVARYPTIGFVATGGGVSGDRLDVEGDLTIKGITRPVRFEGRVVRAGPRRVSALIDAEIDRTAFGITVGRPIYSRFADIRFRLVMSRPRRR